jgi:hypothetical protein
MREDLLHGRENSNVWLMRKHLLHREKKIELDDRSSRVELAFTTHDPRTTRSSCTCIYSFICSRKFRVSYSPVLKAIRPQIFMEEGLIKRTRLIIRPVNWENTGNLALHLSKKPASIEQWISIGIAASGGKIGNKKMAIVELAHITSDPPTTSCTLT